MYRHTQHARTAWLMHGGLSLLLVGIGALDRVLLPWMLLIGALLMFAGWLFREMTVAIDAAALRIHFGGGWLRRQWPLERIKSVKTVTNSRWLGTGIRFTPHGTLYNVESGSGIEFRLVSGATFRLGSDDAEALAAALATAPSPTRNEPFRTNALTH